MNHRTYIWLLAAATLAACGQPPSPGTPRAVPQTEVTTTTTTTTPTTPEVVTPAPPPPPKPPPPRTTTKTTAKPLPKPKTPDRWVFPSQLRGSIEERDGQPFPGVWAGMQDELINACPGKKLCVGYALVVDPSIVSEEDCYIDNDKGISVPNPLYEGGKIRFRVNNNRCIEG